MLYLLLHDGLMCSRGKNIPSVRIIGSLFTLKILQGSVITYVLVCVFVILQGRRMSRFSRWEYSHLKKKRNFTFEKTFTLSLHLRTLEILTSQS